MRRLISAIISVAIALPILVAPVSALTCPGSSSVWGSGSTTRVIFYEAASYVTGDPDGQTVCVKPGSGGYFLTDFRYKDYPGSDGVCDGQLATSFDTWNDCVSSFKVLGTCHWHVTFYSDRLYGGASWYISSALNRSTLGSWNDVISSMRITYSSVCQSSAEG